MNGVATPSQATVAELVRSVSGRLAAVTDTARLEAELLLAESSGLGRAALIARPDQQLEAGQIEWLEEAVARRERGEPLAYVVGNKEFYSLPLSVSPAVLVPRPETELLVDAALERLGRAAARVLDLGTGSGAIALALKSERPTLDVTGIDCDCAALAVARKNADTLDLDVRWIASDWFAALAPGERFDLIVSNPPYVPAADPHFATSISHEPRLALDGGVDGLDAYRAIFTAAGAFLAPGGALIVEHGFDQRDAVIALAEANGFRLESAWDDLAGLPRGACFTGAAQ